MPSHVSRTALAALLLCLAAVPATAAFPGRNGPLIEGYSESGDGPDSYDTRRLIRELDGRSIFGCVAQVMYDPPGHDPCRDVELSEPAVSPDGRSILFQDGDGISLVRRDGTAHQRLGPFHDYLSDASFAPDGRRFVAIAGAPWRPRTWSVAIARIGETNVRPIALGRSPAWSVRGWIAYTRDSRLHRIRPDGSGRRALTRRPCRGASWSPDGRRVACVRGDSVVTMAADGTSVRTIAVPHVSPQLDTAVWSPDGQRFAIEADAVISIVDLRGRVRRRYDIQGNVGAYHNELHRGWDWGPLPR